MIAHPVAGTAVALALATIIVLVPKIPAVRRLSGMGGDLPGAVAPRLFALITFVAGTILLVSGATPVRAGRLGWLDDVLPLPVIEASAYFASIAGVGLIVLARGLQRRLDAAYYATLWMLAGGVVFALAGALDIEQAIALTVMLLVLLPNRRFFYRKASIFEERFTTGWIIAISVVLLGTLVVFLSAYGRSSIANEVFWRFAGHAQGPRAGRAFTLAVVALMGFAVARLLRPATTRAPRPSAADMAAAEVVARQADRASAQLAFLGDKSLLFSPARDAFIMYGVAGRSWVSMGDPVGPHGPSLELIDTFIKHADERGGWPVFYRASAPFVHVYLDYALSVVKLGETARVALPDFSLEGPKRRNLRQAWRRAVRDGCCFSVVEPDAVPALLGELRVVSDEWLSAKRAREKSFSLGRFDDAFTARSRVGVVRHGGRVVAFVTLWESGHRAEVEVDLMRYGASAPVGVMRYALVEAMEWAKAEGYAWFNLGNAPLAGIRTSAVMPVWNQLALAVRGAGERYYNFEGVREFKSWFNPVWEPVYLVSPGGTRRPIILANIAALVGGGVGGAFRNRIPRAVASS